MRNRVIESLVPGLRDANRLGQERSLIGSERLVATRDPLTGLLNGTALAAVGKSIITWARRHEEPVALCCFRLETASPRTTQLLSIAETLRPILDDGDVAARVGDGEIAAVFPDADEERALLVVEAVVARVGRLAPSPADVTKLAWSPIATAVIAVAPGEVVDFDDLLVRARLATRPDGAALAPRRRLLSSLGQLRRERDAQLRDAGAHRVSA